MASPSLEPENITPNFGAPPFISGIENSSPSKQSQQPTQGGSGLMSSLKGGAGSFMKNIRDKSQSVIHTVQHSMATKGNIYINNYKIALRF